MAQQWCAFSAMILIIAMAMATSVVEARSALRQDDGDANVRTATFEPAGMVLTWQRDPQTTMTIDWHTLPADRSRDHLVEYRALGSEAWKRATGDARPFPFSDRTIHRVELTDLEPGTTYEFRFGAASRIFRFRTIQSDFDEQPLRFVTGGDIRHSQEWMERTNRVAMQHDPQFLLWGGDLAYANAREANLDRWYEYFDAIGNTLIDADGLVTPIIVGIGNHEVLDHFVMRSDDYENSDAWRSSWAPYFYDVAAFPGQPGYDVLDFGSFLSIVMTDTGHANPIEGRQTQWLTGILGARTDRFTHIIPVIHVPAYPSVRRMDGDSPFNGLISRQIQTLWCPLFEQANVRVVFANHDHGYKRTVPIRAGERHDDGIVYIGDGAWGVETRDVHDAATTWYLETSQSVRHCIVVTLDGDDIRCVMVDEHGTVIDGYATAASRPSPRPSPAIPKRAH